ncbi:hypothetical protein ACNOYE_27330 [Nannocystaceae bacterium ST9]
MSVVALLACREGGRELDNFEDEVGETGGLPPDLPAIECLPRAMGFVGDCGEDEKCRYLVDPEFGPTGRCVPLIAEGQPGEPCTVSGESDTCRSGSLCWAIDPASDEGVCVDYCSAFLACAADEQACLVGEDGLLALCLDRCVPTDPDACSPGWGCYDSPAGAWGCDRDQSGEAGSHGSPCECVNCCDPGLVCVSAGQVDTPECMAEGAVGCCAEVCELPEQGGPDVACPTENEQCRAYYVDPIPTGYEQVGVCRL